MFGGYIIHLPWPSQIQSSSKDRTFLTTMGAKILPFFIASLAIIHVSLKGVSGITNITKIGFCDAINLCPDREVENALSQMRKELDLLKGRLGALETPGESVPCSDPLQLVYHNISVLY